MGTWGTGILQNDTAAEKLEKYIELVDDAVSHDDALAKLRELHAFEFEHPNLSLDAWIGIAEARWRMGVLDPETRAIVAKLAASDKAFESWSTDNPKLLSARRRAVAKFLAKLETTPKRIRQPKAPRPFRRCEAAFSPGDCLAIQLDPTRWRAAVVIGRREMDWDRKTVVVHDVVRRLQYESTTPPTLQDFQFRDPLTRATGFGHQSLAFAVNVDPRSLRKVKSSVVLVGTAELREDEANPWTEHFSHWPLFQPLRP